MCLTRVFYQATAFSWDISSVDHMVRYQITFHQSCKAKDIQNSKHLSLRRDVTLCCWIFLHKLGLFLILHQHWKKLKEKKKCKPYLLEMVMLNILPFCFLASVFFHQEQNNIWSCMKLQEENFKEGKESNIFLSLEIATAKLLWIIIK